MPYTEEYFERMETDPVLRKQYFWKCAMGMKSRAIKLKLPANKFAEDVHLVDAYERTSTFILENLDRITG